MHHGLLGDDLLYHAEVAGVRGLWSASSITGNPSSLRFAPPYIDDDAKIRVAGSRVVFFADNGSDDEIWSSDGTTLGTQVETALSCPQLSELKTSGDQVYFVCAWDTFNEILTLDDTRISGARGLLRTGSDSITELVPVDVDGGGPDLLYFIRSGDDVWVYDLAGGAGVAVTSLPAGGDPSGLYRFDGGVVYVADSGDGRELHWTDTITNGQIKDINPGGDCDPEQFQRADGLLYFRALDGEHGPEAWVTDGTEQGTTLLADLAPGAFGSYPNRFTPTPAGVFFSNGTDLGLYLTDGTEIGTVRVDGTPSFSSKPDDLFADPSSDRLYFTARMGDGREPFVSDGTLEGTVLLGDLNPGAGSSLVEFLGVLDDGIAMLRAWDGTGDQLLRTDGTEAGTEQLGHAIEAREGVVFLGELYFRGHDGDDDLELWRSDGTALGTERLLDLNPAGSAYPYSLTVFGDHLYFVAEDTDGDGELWRSDGTALGTERVIDLAPGLDGSFPDELVVVGDQLCFFAYDGIDSGLYCSDGTSAGTERILGPVTIGYSEFVADGDRFFFTFSDAATGKELWLSDGTAAGTRLVIDLNDDPTGSDPEPMGVTGGKLIFWGSDGSADDVEQLWATDGSIDDATLLGVFKSRASWVVAVDWNGHLYFRGETSAAGYELWRTDGTPEGTEIFDLVPGDGSARPTNLVRVNDRLFFSAWDPVAKHELFILEQDHLFSDGFESGDTSAWVP